MRKAVYSIKVQMSILAVSVSYQILTLLKNDKCLHTLHGY